MGMGFQKPKKRERERKTERMDRKRKGSDQMIRELGDENEDGKSRSRVKSVPVYNSLCYCLLGFRNSDTAS